MPCGTVSPSNPGYANCDPAYVSTPNYYNLMKTGKLSLEQLSMDTSDSCDFIEDAFEETFTSPTLNTTRWIATELDGQEHCIGLPPAGNTTCTMMMGSMVQLNSTLPGGGYGATLTLSQTPCNGGYACCNTKRTTCAKWAGAHLVSAGCIQYGVLEVEAAFNMPAAGGAFYFTATYIVNGGTDPAWNELDMGFINNAVGQLEYHATVFTANYRQPTSTLMDALNFAGAGIGPSLNVNNSINTINGLPTPQVLYNTSFGSSFHTYKLVWTPTSVAWLVDKVLYRNISYAPWRPMGIRQILRTNKGVNAPAGSPDSNVYLRRIRYTPYSATAVTDAYRCTSMFACYGALKTPPSGSASMIVSVLITPTTSSGRRRHLLDNAADAQAALSSAVAAALPGVVASENVVTSFPAAFGISFVLTVSNLCTIPGGGDALENFQYFGVQNGLIDGLDMDLIPPADMIYVQSVELDSTGCAVQVSLLISGYNATSMASDYALLTSQTSIALTNTALAVNNVIGAVTAVYYTSDTVTSSLSSNFVPTVISPPPSPSNILTNDTICPSYPGSWDNTCRDPSGNDHTVWCATCVLVQTNSITQVITYKVSVQVAATAVAAVESSLNAALLSDVVGGSNVIAATPAGRRLLTAGLNFNVTAPNSLLTSRVDAQLAAADATCSSDAAPRAKVVAALAAAALLSALL